MRKLFLTLSVCALMAAVVSCEYDSPDIRFQQTTTVTNDYSEIVKALQDQTMSLVKRMELLEEALKNQTFTLSQKMDLLNEAYDNGVLKYEEMAKKTIEAIGSLDATVAEKLAAIESAIKAQSTDLNAKLVLIEKALGLIKESTDEGLAGNTKALELVKSAIESLTGTMDEKLTAIEKAVKDQTTALSAKLALIEGAVNSGLVGDDSTLALVKKAIEALNATAGTANDKLDAIKEALDSPISGLNVKLDAIREAVAKGLVSVTEKQELILKALNSSSAYTFTKDELLEVGDDYLMVDDAFWDANQDNYEVVRALKDLIPLSLPHKYKFYFKQSSGRYPISGYEDTSFYGPLYTEGGILKEIRFNEEGVILAVDIGADYPNPAPVLTSLNGHTCYYIKKVNKNCSYQFWVKIGERAAGKNLKVQNMNALDIFSIMKRPDGDYIEYYHASQAIKATTGVWGFRGLEYLPSSSKDNSVAFIIVEDN